ncbi:MAG: hypothetical protein ACP5GX_10800, partial [Anaerolineae bacterium]
FLRLLRENPGVQVFLLNTGRIGMRDVDRQERLNPDGTKVGAKIGVLDSTEIIKQMARGGIRWERDPDWGYEVAAEVEGIDDFAERLDPHRYYTAEEYAELTAALRADRAAWLEKFPELNPEIAASLNL